MKSSFDKNLHLETFVPVTLLLVRGSKQCQTCHDISPCILRTFSDRLLYFFENFVVHWIQIWVLGPQARWNKPGCLPFTRFKWKTL